MFALIYVKSILIDIKLNYKFFLNNHIITYIGTTKHKKPPRILCYHLNAVQTVDINFKR